MVKRIVSGMFAVIMIFVLGCTVGNNINPAFRSVEGSSEELQAAQPIRREIPACGFDQGFIHIEGGSVERAISVTLGVEVIPGINVSAAEIVEIQLQVAGYYERTQEITSVVEIGFEIPIAANTVQIFEIQPVYVYEVGTIVVGDGAFVVGDIPFRFLKRIEYRLLPNAYSVPCDEMYASPVPPLTGTLRPIPTIQPLLDATPLTLTPLPNSSASLRLTRMDTHLFIEHIENIIDVILVDSDSTIHILRDDFGLIGTSARNLAGICLIYATTNAEMPPLAPEACKTSERVATVDNAFWLSGFTVVQGARTSYDFIGVCESSTESCYFDVND